MPTQRFDISILLNVLSQGKEEFDSIGDSIKELAKTAKHESENIGKSLRGQNLTFEQIEARIQGAISKFEQLSAVVAKFNSLSSKNIGGLKSLDDIVSRLTEIQDKANRRLTLDVKTDIKELDIYLKRLEEIRNAAIQSDDKDLFNKISVSVNQATELLNVMKQFEKVSIDKNISVYNSLLDEANAKLKQNLKSAELLSSTGLNPQSLQSYVKGLEDARDTFKILSQEAQNLGISTRSIDTTIENLNNKIKEFKSGTPAKIGTIQGLDDIVKQLSAFEQKAKAGIDIKLESAQAKANLDVLEKSLIALQKEAATTGNTELFNQTTGVLTGLQNTRAELERIAKIPLDRNIADFKYQVDVVTDKLRELEKQGRNLIDTGADVATIKRLIVQIESAQQELIILRNTSEKLGKDTTQINIRIREGEATLKLLKDIDAATVQVKRDEIDLKVKNKVDLQDAISKLKELNQELDEATANKDFRAINKIQKQANEVRALQTSLAPKIQNLGDKQAVNVFSGFTQGLKATEDRLKAFQQEAGTGITRAFNQGSASVRNFIRSSGGTNAGLRAVAGSLRLVGTSAFVVGGELRTLGFAFTGVGAIIQNFGPLLIKLSTNLGLVSIPIIALLGYFAALAIEGLALAGVLAAVAKTGLEFNDAFARTRNNIAGIVGLFFDVQENGESVGKGLDDVSAAQARLAATSSEVSKELRELTFEALTTEFTTEQLFPAFNAVATSASKLAPDLQSLTALTGGLARVSSVAGVSAANLASSITQLIAGTGRVTNPLQRFFNQIKDSSGIELTAKRIKELRAAGGNKLLDELSLVTERFSVLGQEQAKTLSGSFSNIVDAFELFSGAATQKAYDTLRTGFERIKNLVTEQVQKTRINAEGVLENVTVGPKGKEKPLLISQFTKPILELQSTLNNLFDKISKDFLGFLNNVVGYFVRIGQYLTDNYNNILTIYESLKLIVVQTLGIISNFFRIVTLSDSAGSSISEWITILGVVNKLLFGIRLALIGINGILQGLGTLGAFVARGLLVFLKGFATGIARIISIIPGFETVGNAAIVALGAAFDGAIKSVDEFGVASVRSFSNTAAEAQKARNEYEEFNTAAKELKKTKEQKIGEIVLANETPLVVSQDSQTAFPVAGQKVENKFKKFDNAAKVNRLLDLGYTPTDISNIGGFDPKFVSQILGKRENQFKLVKNSVFDGGDEDKKGKKALKDRATSTLQEGKKLAEAQIALAKATEEAQFNIIKDRLTRQQNIIQTQLDANLIAQESATAKILQLKQKEAKLEEETKINDIARSSQRLKLLQDEFKEQEDLIKKQSKGPIERESKLRELNINRRVAELNNLAEIKRLEGEIAQIKERELDLQLETLNAQLRSRQELLNTNIELKNSLAELGDKATAETLAASQRNIVQGQIEQLRKLQLAQDSIKPADFANLGVFAGAGAFLQQRQLLTENLDLLKKQLDIRVQLARFDFVQNTFQSRQNELRLKEDEIQQDLAIGKITEYEADVKIRAIRLQVVEALRAANAELEKSNNITAEQQQLINENKLTIRKLSEELPDSGILDVTKTIGDGFTTLFEKIQEDVGNTKNAFADLAQSILASFRKLIAQRLSEALFDQLLKPNGKVGGFLEKIGLSRTAQINKDAAVLNQNQTNVPLQKTTEVLNTPQKTTEQLIAEINKDFNEQTSVFRNAIQSISTTINQAATSLGIPAISAKQDLSITELRSIGLNINTGNNTQLLALAELQAIKSLLSTNASTSSQFDVGSLIPQDGEFSKGGKVNYFAKGGNVGRPKGKDVVPAYLSNGEYVFSPEIVKMIGLPTLQYLNKFGKLPSFAGGGLFENFGAGRSGASTLANLNFFGGGASLIKKPDPIIEKVLQPAKKKGGLRNILGNILSFAAPFLNLIPVIGQFLALGAGAAGGALTGSVNGKASGILGGIFGGLSNLGGFSGKGGFLGNLSGKVGSPTGQAGLSIFSGLFGNAGSSLGKIFAPSSVGGAGGFGKILGGGKDIFSKLSGLFNGGFLNKILGLFKTFGINSGLGIANGGLIPKLAGGGQADISKLLGLFTAITSISSLFKNSGQGEYTEEVITDPDAARKNLFGSAYAKLTDSGIIPEFKYSDATLKKLQNQFNGIKNLVKVPKQSFLSKIFAILPSLAGLFNFGGKAVSTVGSATKIGSGAINASGFAGGGFVKGKGTGTSDSIFSMIRPESFVLRAKSVQDMEENLLSSIVGNISGFAYGGLVDMIPELATNVNANTSVSIHNYSDQESAIEAFLATPRGQKAILNNLNKNKNSLSRIASQGKGIR